MNKEMEGRTELRHEPEPGYRRIFYIVLSVAILYLCVIFVFG
jgi:putative component of toxin-antitoxin plasmid stabilization module